MISREYFFKDESASTSTELKERVRASDREIYEAVCAKKQTGGRGRTGKSFFSPEGGIYFSASCPLTGKEENPAFITLIAGLCVCGVLQKLCKDVLYIKWPNDVYLNGKKLCGILTEKVGNTAVVGIGINADLEEADVPEELKGIITSLKINGISVPDKKAVVTDIVTALDNEIYKNKALFSDGRLYAEKINERFYLKDRDVKIISGEKEITGRALRVSKNGALIVLTESGEISVISGEVTVV